MNNADAPGEKPVSTPSPQEEEEVSIDISDLYRFDASDLVLDVSEEHYSNLAYMHVAPREVYIDFLALPGVKKDGKMIIKATRIYMSHVAAQRLAETLDRVLEDVHKKGRMESYIPKTEKKAKPKTKP